MAKTRSFFCHPVSVIYFDDREEFLVQTREDNWMFKVGRDLKDAIAALERKVERTGNNHGSLRALAEIKAAGEQAGWSIHHIAHLFPQSPPKEYWL